MAEISANILLQEATKWNGYLEKKSNYYLDELTTNAGDGNFTCFSRDYDNLMNTRKNGYAWCAMYASMMFVYAFGFEKAKSMIGGNLFCGCTLWYNTLKKKGQTSSTPKVGDLIFFKGSSSNTSGHVGIVTKVDATKVYTIEGNTSSTAGMVANGGCVRQKYYKLSYSKILGYGRPLYEVEINKEVKTVTVELPLLKKGSEGKAVETLQTLLNAYGYTDAKCNKLDVDGCFGKGTEHAVTQYQTKNQQKCGAPDGCVGAKTWTSLLGA